MRKLVFAAALAAAALIAPLAGCSDPQVAATNAALDRYDHALDNFTAIAKRVDISVAKTSATVGPYCADAEQIGGNVATIVEGNDTALTALDTIAAALDAFCTDLPSDTGAAVVSLSEAIAAGKAALAAQGG